jgi:hypothetical protein
MDFAPVLSRSVDVPGPACAEYHSSIRINLPKVVREESRLKTGAIYLTTKPYQQRAEFFALPVCSSMSAYGLIRPIAHSPFRPFAPTFS